MHGQQQQNIKIKITWNGANQFFWGHRSLRKNNVNILCEHIFVPSQTDSIANTLVDSICRIYIPMKYACSKARKTRTSHSQWRRSKWTKTPWRSEIEKTSHQWQKQIRSCSNVSKCSANIAFNGTMCPLYSHTNWILSSFYDECLAFFGLFLKSKSSFTMSLINKVRFKSPPANWMKSHLGASDASSLNKAYIYAYIRTQHTSKCNPFSLKVVGGWSRFLFSFHHHSFISKFKHLSFGVVWLENFGFIMWSSVSWDWRKT